VAKGASHDVRSRRALGNISMREAQKEAEGPQAV